jgi:uncharacterized protein
MKKTKHSALRIGLLLGCGAAATVIVSCSEDAPPTGVTAPGFSADRGAFRFEPLASSAVCTFGGDPAALLTLPAGFSQEIIASEPQFADNIDMNTQNETGRQPGRFLYRAHEVLGNGSVSVTDLVTGLTKTIAQRADWERLDPATWTPWGTILIGEETLVSTFRDPDFMAAVAGLVYELFPSKGDPTTIERIVARPALGSKAHEGMRFDKEGNLYSISEDNPGYIYKFTPARRGDLRSGQLFALKVVRPTGDRVGDAIWVPLDTAAVKIDAMAEGDRVLATGYNRPEDVEMGTSTGRDPEGDSNTLFVAVTGRLDPVDNRVIAIDLGRSRHGRGKKDEQEAFVYDYVRPGLNADPLEFEMPDNLALDHSGNLFVTEDPGGTFAGGKRKGDDIWMAAPSRGGGHSHNPASSVVRFATLTDCDAEPTGVYIDRSDDRLFVNIQHRGGDLLDKAEVISQRRH